MSVPTQIPWARVSMNSGEETDKVTFLASLYSVCDHSLTS